MLDGRSGEEGTGVQVSSGSKTAPVPPPTRKTGEERTPDGSGWVGSGRDDGRSGRHRTGSRELFISISIINYCCLGYRPDSVGNFSVTGEKRVVSTVTLDRP